jgi:two-component system sensor histidine kinase KdpD
MSDAGMAGASRGRLRLFTGAAPAVGKTTRMLEEALRLQAAGVDVVVAFLDGRGRPAVEALAAALPEVARRRLELHGVSGGELDFPRLLERRPAVAVIDDLAHVNAPGGRHARRYREVEELLASGIDVLATLGIYQLDSLNEIVESLSGVTVRETVPDSVLRAADGLVHVDVGTDALRARLDAGALYGPEQRNWAGERWFRPATLDALRELAFRQVAEALATRQAAPRADAVSDRVMVCLSSFSPRAMALLRRGSRIAGRLNTHWYVVYVETPRERPSRMPEDVRRHLAASVEKARELGAEVVFLKGRDPVRTLVEFAQSHHVAHVVIGHSPGRFWTERLGRSVVARLTRLAGGFDLYVLATEREGT